MIWQLIWNVNRNSYALSNGSISSNLEWPLTTTNHLIFDILYRLSRGKMVHLSLTTPSFWCLLSVDSICYGQPICRRIRKLLLRMYGRPLNFGGTSVTKQSEHSWIRPRWGNVAYTTQAQRRAAKIASDRRSCLETVNSDKKRVRYAVVGNDAGHRDAPDLDGSVAGPGCDKRFVGSDVHTRHRAVVAA